MSRKTENGYRDIVTHLEQMIATGSEEPNFRLPSLRELCSEFNVSVSTVRRSLDVLRKSGRIEVRHGAGSYVRKPDHSVGPAGRSGRKIGVIIAENDLRQSYCAHALRSFQSAAMLHECSLLLNCLRLFSIGNELAADRLPEVCSDCDAVVMLGEYDRAFDRLPAGRPYVGVEMGNSYHGMCSTLTLDPFSAAVTACEFFRARRCRKVRAVVIPHLPVHRHRAAVFLEEWRQHGGEAEVFVYHDPASEDEILALDIGDPDCGYWFSSGTVCQRLAEPYRRKTGRYLGADRHVLALDGKSLLVDEFEPVSTIGASWHDIGLSAFAECARRLASPQAPAQRIYLEGQLTTFEDALAGRRRQS